MVMMADEYDSSGQLFRFNHAFTYAQPGIPALWAQPNVVYDLRGGGYCSLSMFNFKDGDEGYYIVPPKPMSYYQPDAIAAESAR